jgi:hypothetical protein
MQQRITLTTETSEANHEFDGHIQNENEYINTKTPYDKDVKLGCDKHNQWTWAIKRWVQVGTGKSDRYLTAIEYSELLGRQRPNRKAISMWSIELQLESYHWHMPAAMASSRERLQLAKINGPPDSVRSPFAQHAPSNPKIRRDASKERQSLPWLNWKLRRLCKEGSPPKVFMFSTSMGI